MIPKNRIHLSRSLHAQTTPYPEVGRWIKRGILLLVIALGAGIYVFAKPAKKSEPLTTPKQILGEQQPPQKVEYETYKVKKGDTLFNLSQKYNVSWQTLAELNNLAEPYVLKIGQELKIPKK